MSAKTKSCWIPLASCPLDIDQHHSSPSVLFPLPLILSDTELLVIPYTHREDALFKYNINNNQWTKWIKYPEELKSLYHTASINKNKTLLYIFNELGNIIEISLKTQQFTISQQSYHDGSHTASICIDGLFHIFGGWLSEKKSHFTWNPNKQNLSEIYKFKEIKNDTLRSHSIQYIASIHSVLIIPGYLYDSKEDLLYLYSLKTNICNQLPVKLKECVHESCCVMTYDERFVIVFGKKMTDHSKKDTLITQVLDLKQMIVTKVDIDGPINTSYSLKATIMSNHKNSELITFGYIRRCWTLSDFENVPEIPIHLIDVIKLWYVDEIIYLMDIKNMSLWKMPVDIIINCLV